MTDSKPVQYRIRFPDPGSHYAEVEARIPVPGVKRVEIFLPVWTPGSYLVREYARNLEGLRANSVAGETLRIRKSRKNRWEVEGSKVVDELILCYSLYCHELSVRTNWVDENFALIVGAATFLNVLNDIPRTYEVSLELPPDWDGAWSGMPLRNHHFCAADYDQLIDSPIAAGRAVVHKFQVNNIPHSIVSIGDSSLWDGESMVADVERMVQGHLAFWGELPYESYVFLNLITGGRGALEHANSMVLMSDRFAMRTRSAYVGWLQLISHEHFHVWNVKRLRPIELGPFDYENEVYTRNLWIAEGFTEYYGILGVRRAGLCTDAEFLGGGSAGGTEPASLSALVEQLQTTPGRLVQSVSLASFDAWIKLYRPDENSANSSVSYYTKGAVLAWLLDGMVRRATLGAKSLDDVMRQGYRLFASESGFTSNDFSSLIQQVCGCNLDSWLSRTVDSTEELEYKDVLDWFGLRFEAAEAAGKNSEGSGMRAWMGVTTRVDAGRLMVARVARDTPAWTGGLSPGDEILGIDAYRVGPEQWEKRMGQYRPGEEITLLVSRNERITSVRVRLEPDPAGRWRIVVDPARTEQQQIQFEQWLGTNQHPKNF